jgi:hypothetical protein
MAQPAHVFLDRTLEAMSSIAVDVVNRDLKGGALLSLLHDHVIGQLNDATAAEIALHLAQLASVPYVAPAPKHANCDVNP